MKLCFLRSNQLWNLQTREHLSDRPLAGYFFCCCPAFVPSDASEVVVSCSVSFILCEYISLRMESMCCSDRSAGLQWIIDWLQSSSSRRDKVSTIEAVKPRSGQEGQYAGCYRAAVYRSTSSSRSRRDALRNQPLPDRPGQARAHRAGRDTSVCGARSLRCPKTVQLCTL